MATWTDLTDSFNNEEQIQEMKKKYENCYLFLKPRERDKVLCKYNGYDGNFHIFVDIHGTALQLLHDTQTEVICIHPDKGLFNTDSRMMYYTKLPNRQYRRGVCKDNSLIFDPVQSLWTTHNIFSGYNLGHAFDSKYEHITQALEVLRKREKVSVAISKDFGISLSVTKDEKLLYLWYHDSCIGLVTNNNVVVVKNEFFQQEVQDNVKLFDPLKVQFE